MTNWACVLIQLTKPTAELVIVGPEYQSFALYIYQKKYQPNKVLCAAEKGGELPLLEGREARDEKTTVYVCYNHTCQRPVFSPEEALDLL